MAQRSLANRLWYDFLRVLCRLVGVTYFRLRVFNRQATPATGPALILSNHQSHLDPVLIGVACDRRISPLARESLFRFPPLRWLIQSLDAIPINRDGLGLTGLKETLRRLKQDGVVLIFPEGTRTRDGRIAPLKPGFCALARRGEIPLAPVAIAGAFDCWPRSARFPRPGRIVVVFGTPITPAETAALDDDALVAEVAARIDACFLAAERHLGRKNHES